MDKKTYYVTVDGTIHEEQLLDDAPYDYAIEASDEEIQALQSLFDETYDHDWHTFVEAHLPYKTEKRQQASLEVDENVREIYKMIYQLGTEETKQSIASLGLLDLS
jgi:hypothetical protein